MLIVFLNIAPLFMLILAFLYSPSRHPIVATFIRSTFGLGIKLTPIFLPVLIFATFRCLRMLDEFEDAEPKQFD